jgi:hypothetical protein
MSASTHLDGSAHGSGGSPNLAKRTPEVIWTVGICHHRTCGNATTETS